MDSKRIVMCQRSSEIFSEYCGIFKRLWDIERDQVIDIGCAGKTLFAAEFKEHGTAAYGSSLVLPIRNACYMAAKMESKWDKIRLLNPTEPIMDYGCGVGFQLLWLKRIGFNRLYGHEIPGVQRKVMLEAFKPHGIKPWLENERMETVICINVLEHLENPVETLGFLKSIGNMVIANVCLDEDDEPHIAPMADRLKCSRLLKEWGTLVE